DAFFGRRGESVEWLKRRGHPGTAVSAFAPSIDPTDVGYANYTLDLSHTATAGVDALELMDRMGDGLRHLHLTDGLGAAVDEHLVPGRGT
ncbi:sugar phosphate isomerase/epimerase, partial [Mycobacterium kansasii]